MFIQQNKLFCKFLNFGEIYISSKKKFYNSTAGLHLSIFFLENANEAAKANELNSAVTFLETQRSFINPDGFYYGHTVLIDPHTSQQHAGLQHPVLQHLQEVTRPKTRLKPT